MSVPGFFGFELDLSPNWEGLIQALMLILAILLFSIRNCLKDESCQAVVAKAEEIQDRISETECSGRLDARVRKKIKERGPSRNSKEVKMGENIGPQGQKLSVTNAGLAAAIMQSQKHPFKGPDRRVCFKCGKPGHLKKDCRSSEKERAPPMLCSRCGKGYHRAELCRSVRDAHGKILPPLGNPQIDDPKNGMAGPRSQGPQKYGNKFVRATTEGPSEAEQEWTCVPPPTSY